MKKIAMACLLALCLANFAFADLSIQEKSTNVGIASEKPATLIFDVVNMDTEHKATGFLLCMSPDNAQVSSTLGAASGSGAQYLSPFFTLDTAPDQESITLTVESSSAGEKDTGCQIKYIPYKEGAEGAKKYLKMNGQYVDAAKDEDYRVLALRKSLVFNAKVVQSDIFSKIPGGQEGALIGVAAIIVLAIAYLFGKTSH